jgi:hypothetical protein
LAGVVGSQWSVRGISACGTALAVSSTVSMRRRSFDASRVSESRSSVRRTCSTMLDWPEHSHTSPTSTSTIVCAAPSALLTASVYGPPAGSAGSVACQWPSASARPCTVWPAKRIVSAAPGFAWPQTGSARSRCSTAWSWNSGLSSAASAAHAAPVPRHSSAATPASVRQRNLVGLAVVTMRNTPART